MDDINTNPGIKVKWTVNVSPTTITAPRHYVDEQPIMLLIIPLFSAFTNDFGTVLASGFTYVTLGLTFTMNEATGGLYGAMVMLTGGGPSTTDADLMTTMKNAMKDQYSGGGSLTSGIYGDISGSRTIEIDVNILQTTGFPVTVKAGGLDPDFTHGGLFVQTKFNSTTTAGDTNLLLTQPFTAGLVGGAPRVKLDTLDYHGRPVNLAHPLTFYDFHTKASTVGLQFTYEGAQQWGEKVICSEQFVDSV